MWLLLWYLAIFIGVRVMLWDIRENNPAFKAHKKAADEAMRFQREMIKWG